MSLHFLAMAAPQGGGAAPSGAAGLLGFIPWIAIIVIFYFLLIRPQAKRQKQHAEMLKNVKKGDKIVTAGGIHGEVVGVKDENTLIVKIDANTKVELERSSIGRVTQSYGQGE